ncbi:MAG: hypothetical protein GYB65_16995, partial [Chloroflexi bacterium]|nr:hypothetical protein [Chloroflexota bacterium]
LHCVVGLFFYAKPLGEIARAGFFNAADKTPARDGAFWFMFTGAMLLLLGEVVRWTHKRTGTLPASLGWGFLALSVVGALMMPVSGFWLVIPVSGLLLRAARR